MREVGAPRGRGPPWGGGGLKEGGDRWAICRAQTAAGAPQHPPTPVAGRAELHRGQAVTAGIWRCIMGCGWNAQLESVGAPRRHCPVTVGLCGASPACGASPLPALVAVKFADPPFPPCWAHHWQVRITCPDATGLGVDLARMLLDFGLRWGMTPATAGALHCLRACWGRLCHRRLCGAAPPTLLALAARLRAAAGS